MRIYPIAGHPMYKSISNVGGSRAERIGSIENQFQYRIRWSIKI